MLIDFHTHCFPDKIAESAVKKLAYDAGGLERYTDGTVDGLKKLMRESGVDAAVVLNIATNTHQMQNVNNFAASINNEKDIFAFGSVFPKSPDALDELERIKALGLRGVKFHPEYQSFFVDDEKMKPIYKKISELGLITVFHAGEDYGFAPPVRCTPERMRRALKWFDSPVVAAHWGGLGYAAEVAEKLCGLDIYFDVSFGYAQLSRENAKRIVEKHGAEKLLFGTDAPWQTAQMEHRLLDTLELSDAEKEMIYSGNAKKLLGIGD